MEARRTFVFKGAVIQERPPFYETIIGAIRRVPVYSLPILAELIRETKILKNHDEIIAAWKEKTNGLMLDEGFLGFDVVADILQQKEEAAAEAEFQRQAANSMGID